MPPSQTAKILKSRDSSVFLQEISDLIIEHWAVTLNYVLLGVSSHFQELSVFHLGLSINLYPTGFSLENFHTSKVLICSSFFAQSVKSLDLYPMSQWQDLGDDV
jgi:hypothetical protein